MVAMCDEYYDTECFACSTCLNDEVGHTIAIGATWGTRTPKDSDYVAACRCVTADNSKGISICNSGCGDPNTVCWAGVGCALNERNCDKNKCTCKPSDILSNAMTFGQCKSQCDRVGMVVPSNNAGMTAATNTGCDINGLEMWINEPVVNAGTELTVNTSNVFSGIKGRSGYWIDQILFQFTGCGGTQNSVCSNCSECSNGQYRSSDCSGTQNSVCSTCSTCSSGE